MDNINPSVFQYINEPYELEFERILTGITACYKMMIKDNVSVPLNDENRTRDILLLDYLKNNTARKSVQLNDFLFDKEVPEDYSDGRVDIKIQTQNTFKDTSAFYIIECKRLDNKNLSGTTGLNAKYIKNGIMRFIKRKYSAYYGLNGMIGFVVEQMDIDNNINIINKLLNDSFKKANTKKKLTSIAFIKHFKHSYYSAHNDVKKKEIKLYHLMFNFSNNIDKLNCSFIDMP